jgi:hypothetical protein
LGSLPLPPSQTTRCRQALGRLTAHIIAEERGADETQRDATKKIRVDEALVAARISDGSFTWDQLVVLGGRRTIHTACATRLAATGLRRLVLYPDASYDERCLSGVVERRMYVCIQCIEYSIAGWKYILSVFDT